MKRPNHPNVESVIMAERHLPQMEPVIVHHRHENPGFAEDQCGLTMSVRGVYAGQQYSNQINRILRSIVLITESIFPFNACFARLRVKLSATWNGTCAGNESA